MQLAESLVKGHGPQRLLRITTLAAVVIALMISLVPPAGYAVLNYNSVTVSADEAARYTLHWVRQVQPLNESGCDAYASLQQRWQDTLGTLYGKRFVLEVEHPCGSFAINAHDLGYWGIQRQVTDHDDGVPGYRVKVGAVGFAVDDVFMLVLIVSAWLGVWSYLFVRYLPLQALKEALADLAVAKEEILEAHVAKESAEANTRLRSMFLANVTHELRTPMNGVIGMLELIKDTGLNEEQVEFVKIAHDASLDLVEAINDILDFSKIESNSLDTLLIDFQCHELCSSFIRRFELLCAEKGLRFELDNQLPAGISLHSDPVRIRQVVSQLLSNAIKYTRQGAVRLAVALREGNHTMLHIEVHDTGIGIPAAQQQQIFAPFAQGDESLSREFSGLGLGLAVTSHVVNLLGGTLNFESQVGKGTVFTLEIPVQVVA